MKIYTKTGDGGETGLFAGPRVKKCHPRIEAYGDVDELNSVVGLARAEELPADTDAVLERVQHELFALGAELATPDPAAHGTQLIGADHVKALESAIDASEAKLTPLREFILPGGSRASAALHHARSVCRRAERQLVELAEQPHEVVSEAVICYVNRLSDLLFVAAGRANAAKEIADIVWQKPTAP